MVYLMAQPRAFCYHADMNEDKPTTLLPDKNNKILTPVLVVIIIILAILLVWCWRDRAPKMPGGSSKSPGDTTETAGGPCTGGAENTAPAGFTFYENPSLGYRFAYPSAWGSVTVTTTPIASETGNYVMGRFSANDRVWFGGNATDYTVRGRDGVPTDLPGYLKVSGKFYTVEIWKFNDGSSIEDRNDLHLIDMPYEEKAGCNTTALVTSWPESELSSIGPADVARFNLKPTSPYYGVNFVMDKPEATTRDQLHELIATFQLY